MKKVVLKEKYCLEYIKDAFNNFKKNRHEVEKADYHHNCSYDSILSILENGILPIKQLHSKKIRNFSDEELLICSDVESHANGFDGISLSKVGLDDLYHNEYVYNPLRCGYIDLIISNCVKAFRYTVNYGNEFITYQKIPVDYIKSIDIRLLEYIADYKKGNGLNNIVEKYNSLIRISQKIIDDSSNVTVREMSDDNNCELDVDGLSKSPILVLKR